MKSRMLIALGIAVCLCLGACSLQDTEVLNSEPEQEASSSYTPVSLDYKAQKLPQDTIDTMAADGFQWGGRGAPELSVKWKGDDELLFFLYRIDPFLPSNSMRIFSYQLSTNTLSFLTEIAEYDLTGNCFQQGEFSYLCLNRPYFAKVCRIGNGTAETMDSGRNPFLVVYLSKNLTLLYRLPGRTLKRSRRNCMKIITIPRTIWQIIPIFAVLPSGDIHI